MLVENRLGVGTESEVDYFHQPLLANRVTFPGGVGNALTPSLRSTRHPRWGHVAFITSRHFRKKLHANFIPFFHFPACPAESASSHCRLMRLAPPGRRTNRAGETEQATEAGRETPHPPEGSTRIIWYFISHQVSISLFFPRAGLRPTRYDNAAPCGR